MFVRYLFSIFIGLFLLSCSNDQVPSDNITLPPVVKEESVSPTIKKAKGNSEELEKVAIAQDKTIQKQKEALARAEAIAAKIRSQIESGELVDKKDLDSLETELEIIKSDNSNLKNQNLEFQHKIKELEQLLDDANDKSIKKDKEVEGLESQVTFYKNKSDSLVLEKNDAIKERDKAKEEAANAKVYKSWVLWLVGGFVAYLLLKNIVASIFPQAQFLRRL